MTISPSVRLLAAAGVVAGLALPSVGTFYALRLQYPDDPLILGLAITSWCLVGAAAALFVAGLLVGARKMHSVRRERAADWAANGEALRGTIDHLAAIADRETQAFITMEAAEQEYLDRNPNQSGRHAENAQRLLKQAEMIRARQELAQVRTRFLEIAPRHARRKAIEDWSNGSVRNPRGTLAE